MMIGFHSELSKDLSNQTVKKFQVMEKLKIILVKVSVVQLKLLKVMEVGGLLL